MNLNLNLSLREACVILRALNVHANTNTVLRTRSELDSIREVNQKVNRALEEVVNASPNSPG